VCISVTAVRPLQPGDCLTVGVVWNYSGGRVRFGLLLLADLQPGEKVHVTDDAWSNAEGGFRDLSGERDLKYTAEVVVGAGTVLRESHFSGGRIMAESTVDCCGRYATTLISSLCTRTARTPPLLFARSTPRVA